MVQEDLLEIRLMKAAVDVSLLGHEHGWRMHDKGHVIGFHISNKFIDPLDYNLQFYDMYRTKLCFVVVCFEVIKGESLCHSAYAM
jgi:hypothetical protein